MGIEEPIPGVGFEVLDRKAEPPAVDVDIGYYRVNLLALLEHVGWMLDALGPRDVRNVHQTIDTVLDLDKRAEVGQRAHFPGDPRANVVANRQRFPRIRTYLFETEAYTAAVGIGFEDDRFDILADR